MKDATPHPRHSSHTAVSPLVTLINDAHLHTLPMYMVHHLE
jgi:hypothetical protein